MENQRVRLTKQLLRESLFEMMQHKDISKISVSELCKNAGINRSTFYTHYGSPYDVLADAGDHFIEEINSYLDRRDPEHVQPLQVQVEITCHFLLEHRKEAVPLFRYNRSDSEFARKLLQMRMQTQPEMAGLLKTLNKEEKELAASFYTSGIYSVICTWFLRGMDITPEEIAALAVKIISH